MLKSVTVTNYHGESLKLEMGRPSSSGFYIKRIEGLGPTKANINITERTTMDGGQYSSSHANSRNIVITLGFLFDNGIEDMRHKSYKYFPLKKKVKLLIETDRRTCETYGYVESNEPDIFNKEETTQISIVCPDSYFYSAGNGAKTVTLFSGVDSLFEFPFSNESLTDDEIEFGSIQRSTMGTVLYSGEADIGITIYIHAIGNVTNPTIYNLTTRESMKIDTTRLRLSTGSAIVAGDDIIICTMKGEKSIQLLREGTYYNILNCLDKRANWFQISNGDNVFMYSADSGEGNLEFRIEHKTAYEGV